MIALQKVSDIIPFQKAQDSIFAKLFTRKISRVISFLLLKFFPKISPNAISGISFFITLAAIALFLSPNYFVRLVGVILLQLGFAFDCSDGEVARYKNELSKFGGWLDSTFDRVKEAGIFLALTYLIFQREPRMRFLVFNFLTIILWMLLAYFREAKRSFWPNLKMPEFFITKNIYIGTVDVIIYLVSLAIIFKVEKYMMLLFFIAAIPLLFKQILGAFKLSKKNEN